MENKKNKSLPFAMVITAVILGITLYKQFNFKTLTFEHNGLAVVYFIGFAISIYFIVKSQQATSGHQSVNDNSEA